MDTKKRRSLLYGAAFASALLATALAEHSHAQNDPASLIAGARWNDGIPFGTVGIAWKASSRLSLYTTADPGKPRGAYALKVAVIFPLSSRFSLAALCGPAVEAIPIDTSEESVNWYLLAATGAALTYKLNNQVSVWIAYDYLIDPDHISPNKYGFGLIAGLGKTP